MIEYRVIPILLLRGKSAVKTERFKNANYLGDPINILRIFNEKEVDELTILDIGAYQDGINFDYLKLLASEAFMPLAYGGAIRSIEEARKIFSIGFEKIIINTSAFLNPNLIVELSKKFGSQSIVISIDYKKDFLGRRNLYYSNGTVKSSLKLDEFVRLMEENGAGEFIFQFIDREGTMKGLDLEFCEFIREFVKIPSIVTGGASTIESLQAVLDNGLSVAAGSLFVYYGKYRAVLISYPKDGDLNKKYRNE